MRSVLPFIVALLLLSMQTASSDAGCVIVTQASVSASTPADGLLFALTVGLRPGEAGLSGVQLQDLSALRKHIIAFGVPPRAIVRSGVQEVSEAYRQIRVLDKRPYGFILMRFTDATQERLQWLSAMTADVLTKPLRAGLFVQSVGPWYALTDCASLANASRDRAISRAGMAAESLARAAGTRLLSQTPLAVDTLPLPASPAASPYLCGASLPVVPPPQMQLLGPGIFVAGQFTLTTRLRARWATTGPASTPPVPDMNCLTSYHEAPTNEKDALRPGEVRSSVAVGADSVQCIGNRASATPMSVAIAVANQRITWLSNDLGAVAGATDELFDPEIHEEPSVVTPPLGFRSVPTIKLIEARLANFQINSNAQTMQVKASGAIRVPADTARIVVGSSSKIGLVADPLIKALDGLGIKPAAIRITTSAITVDIDKPSARLLQAIHEHLEAVGTMMNVPLSAETVFSTERCDTGEQLALASAVTAARNIAKDQATARNVSVMGVIAGADLGDTPETYCGPNVVTSPGEYFQPAQDAATPSVLFESRVLLDFSLTNTPTM